MENTHPCIVSSSGGEVVRRCRGQLHFNQTPAPARDWRESSGWRLERRLLTPEPVTKLNQAHFNFILRTTHRPIGRAAEVLKYITFWIFFSLLRWKGKSEEEGLFTNQLFWNEKWIILTDLNWLKYYLLGPRWQRGWRARPRELRQTNTTKSI